MGTASCHRSSWPSACGLTLVAVATILLFPTSPSDATGEGPVVFVTFPDRDYAVGSVVEVRVLTFEDYRPMDPDDVGLDVGGSDRPVALTRLGTGLYAADVTIQAGDLEPGTPSPYFQLDARAGLGGGSVERTEGIWVVEEGGLDVRLVVPDAGDLLPAPGQWVEFLVLVTHGGEFVDPDTGTLDVSFVNGTGGVEPVPTMRSAAGHFRGVVVIPDDEGDRGSWDLFASAGLTVGASDPVPARSLNDSSHLALYVRTMDVWYDALSVGVYGALLYFTVSDLEGAPIEGARIELEWDYLDSQGARKEGAAQQTTESEGGVLFPVSYPELAAGAWRLEFQGRCTHGGLSQPIKGGIALGGDRTRDDYPPDPHRYTAIPRERVVRSDGRTDVTFDVSQGGTPLPNCTVFGYVADEHGVYWSGQAATDASGSFTIPLDMAPRRGEDVYSNVIYPSFFVRLPDGSSVRAEGGELCVFDWDSEWEMRAALGPAMTLDVAPGQATGELRFELRAHGADGDDEQVRVMWGVGAPPGPLDVLYGGIPPDVAPADFIEDYYPSNGWRSQAEVAWSDGAWRGTIRVPGCVPQLANLYLTAELTFYDRPVPETRYAYSRNVTGLMANGPPTVAIHNPRDGASYEGVLRVDGNASDDRGVLLVEVRLDGGDWAVVQGTWSWECLMDAHALPAGDHTLEARAFDGQRYSSVASVGFIVPGEGTASGAAWLVVVAVVLACIAIGVAAVRLGRRG